MYKRIIEIIKELDDKSMKGFIAARKLSLMPKTENVKYLGANSVDGWHISKTNSSTRNFLDKQEIALESGLMDVRYQTIGNIDDAYHMFIQKIINEDEITFSRLCQIVYEIVTEYFGYDYSVEKRSEAFKSIDDVASSEISTIKGKNIAMCTERAALSHNLLKFVGIDSTIKFSQVITDEKNDVHAYNLINNDNKYYIFDSSIPRKNDDSITPLVTRITEDAYSLISSPEYNVGASVKVTYETPRRENMHVMIYDARRDYMEEYDYSK